MLKSISPQDLALFITAGATVIYTIGTLLLWYSTRANVRALEHQLSVLKSQAAQQTSFYKVTASNTVLDAHREIYLSLIENPKLARLLQTSLPAANERTIAELLASIMINHCSRVYQNFQHGFFDHSDFAGFYRDARDLFNVPLIKWRWETVAKYHSDDFVKFINDQHNRQITPVKKADSRAPQ